MRVEITFDTALQEVVAAVQRTDLDLAGCELTLLRDLAGRIRLHAACPAGQRWPAGSRETLKTALRAAQPYHTEVVYLEILGEGSREFPLTDRLVSERQPYAGGERTENSPAWFRFERRFSKDSWLQETGRPQEPWPLENAPVVVSFFGFKGGVGRTSALAAFALHLADQGKSVAAVDLDLEAPGLASLLLGEEIPTDLGVVDFLVEERLDRSSPLALSRFYLSSPHVEGNGILRVFPAGRLNENYVEKLGRIDIQGLAEPEFSARSLLRRLIGRIRDEVRPDAILLDVRAGLHDLGGISLAGLSHLELIFAVHSAQTWEGLPLVLRHLGRLRSDWVKLVHTLVPPLGRGGDQAHGEFVSHAYELCSEHYYLEEDLPGPEDETATHHAYRLPFREALMGLSDLHRSRADLLADEHRLFCEQLARDVGLGD
jgi:cellulose biosynthesis protein BcsQ